MPTVQTPRLHHHYRTHGPPDGMPLLLLHGSFATSRWWEPLFACLPDVFFAVAPDLRGSGGSEKPPDGYTIETLAEDLGAFVDAIALTEFDLIAHASSGAVAIEYILNHPDAARSLVLVDSVPIEGVFTPLEALSLLDRMRTERPLLRTGLAALAPGVAASDAPFFETLVDDAAAQAPAAFTEIAAALGSWNRFASARALTLPTLLIWGDQDPIVPRDAMTRTLIAIPGAGNMEVLRGVGHSPMLDAPFTLAEKIVDFVTDDFDRYAGVRDSADHQP